jgi:hypothetical protein
MNTELIGTIANISLALSLIVGLVFGISQARAAARDRRERLTLETLRFFGSREFAELLQYVDTHPAPKSREALRALPAAEQTIIIQFTMLMENLGILVAEKMVDLDLVDETLGSFVVTTWLKFKPMSLSTRKADNDPTMSEYYQWMAETIDARMKANPRPPAYERLPQHH